MSRGLLALAIAADLRGAHAEPCPVTAVLDGNATLVDEARELLAARGIATRASDACPAAKVRIERRGPSIAVTITDPNGRHVERAFADVETAASLIESWARVDESDSLLAGFAVAARPKPSPISVAAHRPAPRAPRWWLAAAPELSVDSRGVSWLGGRAHGCVRVGLVCAGALTRSLATDARRSVDVVAAVDVQFALGARTTAALGAGAGVGWFSAPHPSNDLRQTLTFAALRLDAHATLAIAITRWLWVDLGVAAGSSPSAAPVVEMGESIRRLDEPGTFARGELGLRIGVP